MQDELVKVASFIFPGDAHLLKMRLEADGMKCCLLDEEIITMDK